MAERILCCPLQSNPRWKESEKLGPRLSSVVTSQCEFTRRKFISSPGHGAPASAPLQETGNPAPPLPADGVSMFCDYLDRLRLKQCSDAPLALAQKYSAKILKIEGLNFFLLQNIGDTSLSFLAIRVLNSAMTFGEAVENRHGQRNKGNVLAASHQPSQLARAPVCRLVSVRNSSPIERIWVRIWLRPPHKFDLVFLR